MEVIRNFTEIPPYHSRIYDEYFGGLNTCIMDIETSGLYPNSSRIILGGLLLPRDKGFEVVQYFADKEKDEADKGKGERDLLEAYGNALSACDVFITYNGGGFDLPFLKQRFMRNGLRFNLDLMQSFDLYRALRYYSKMREILPNLKQKTIETFLGLSPHREDGISGRESVVLYEQYLRSGSSAAREKVLLHNRDDLVQLASVLKILNKLDLHRILFHEGFTVAMQDKRIYVKSLSIGQKALTITGRTRNVNLDYYSFETGYQAIHKAGEKEMVLTIPFEKRHGATFIDLESIAADFKPLEQYPSYESGYLILKEKGNTNYAEINKTAKIILGQILGTVML